MVIVMRLGGDVKNFKEPAGPFVRGLALAVLCYL